MSRFQLHGSLVDAERSGHIPVPQKLPGGFQTDPTAECRVCGECLEFGGEQQVTVLRAANV